MPNAVAVVATIEASSVMQTSGFVDAVTIGAQAFIDDLLAGDAVAVASFNAQASVAYPTGGGVAVVDATLSQLTQADAAVRALTYTSPSVGIGGGLAAAYAALAAAPAGSRPGVLLLSSGQNNTGTDPLTLGSYQPTWACAPGPTANATLLNQIAALSRGAYYYAPTPADMGTILNQVRGQRPGWQTVVNATKSVAPLGFWLQPLTLPPGLTKAQFSIVWENANLTWTGSSNPGPNQVSVTLVQPPGITLPVPPTLQGGGYCVFNLDNPASGPGQWYVQVMYPGSTALAMSIGVFATPGSVPVPALRVEPVRPPRAGEPLTLRVELGDDAGPLDVELASAEIVSPRGARQAALPVHPDAHVRRTVPLAIGGTRPHEFVAVDAAVAGSVNCKLHVRARRAGSGDAFERTHLVSLLVPDSPSDQA